jgi:hypothetical protein
MAQAPRLTEFNDGDKEKPSAALDIGESRDEASICDEDAAQHDQEACPNARLRAAATRSNCGSEKPQWLSPDPLGLYFSAICLLKSGGAGECKNGFPICMMGPINTPVIR